MSDDAKRIDHSRLLAEIDAEAARRRESGELPADFERELDLVFARFAPVHAIGDDFGQVLERAEQSSFIDVLAPTESSMPVVPQVKRLVRKAITWEMRYVAQQASAFATASARATRLLGERVDRLERVVGVDGSAPPAAAKVDPDWDHWAPVLIAALGTRCPGRVLHADAGDGDLVGRLNSAGLDAYGTDPVSRSGTAGIELRLDVALDHLAALPDETLGGLVLSGCVERLTAPEQQRLARLAGSKVSADGVVVVVSAHPRAWTDADPVAADLAAGRPLHAETWVELLCRSRPTGGAVDVVDGPSSNALAPVAGAAPDLAANLTLLAARVFPPDSYAVIARPTA